MPRSNCCSASPRGGMVPLVGRWRRRQIRRKRERAVPTRLRTLQRDLLDSLWFTPTVIALLYAALALVLLRADQALGLDTQGRDAWAVGGEGFVPVTAVAVAIVLALVSIGFMIYTINHVARSVQVAVIIKRVTHDTLDLLDEPLAGEIDARHDPDQAGQAFPEEQGETIATEGDGYLEAIDAGALLAAAEMRGLLVRTEALVGSFLLSGAPLATVWPKGVVDEH